MRIKLLLPMLALVAAGMMFAACEGEVGPQGPKGDAGTAGTAGSPGAKGDKGLSF